MAMSLGRRKKNSTPLARSMTVRSWGRSGAGSRPPRGSPRRIRTAPLVQDRDTQHGSHSELSVDVVEGQSARDHQHLRPVQQLADLPASASSVSCSAASHTSPASSRTFLPRSWTPPSSAATVPLPAGRCGPAPQFGEQLLEGLHGQRLFHAAHRTVTAVSPRAAAGLPSRACIMAWLVPAAILVAVAAGCSNTVVNTGEKAEQTETPPSTARTRPATTSWSMRSTSSPTPRSATAATYFISPSGAWRCVIVARMWAGCQSAGGSLRDRRRPAQRDRRPGQAARRTRSWCATRAIPQFAAVPADAFKAGIRGSRRRPCRSTRFSPCPLPGSAATPRTPVSRACPSRRTRASRSPRAGRLAVHRPAVALSVAQPAAAQQQSHLGHHGAGIAADLEGHPQTTPTRGVGQHLGSTRAPVRRAGPRR